jgi:hypothetical protein
LSVGLLLEFPSDSRLFQIVNIVRDHRHQCAVVSSCTRIISADASKAQRLLYQRRRKALKISTKVPCEICARSLSAPAATSAAAAAAPAASAGVLTFGCGHVFHGTGSTVPAALPTPMRAHARLTLPADACLFAAMSQVADAVPGRKLWCVTCHHKANEAHRARKGKDGAGGNQ